MMKTADQASDSTTHFGYETVPKDVKAGRVRAVFDSVVSRYDLMNDLMSGGVHRLWKNAMVDWLAPQPDWRVLDMAGGTGDIAFRVLGRMNRSNLAGGTGSIVVCDINHAMIEKGRDRAIDTGRLHGLDWTTGDAERLPFPDSHFDAYTVAFGLRNVTAIEDALKEARRVLAPGGRFLCLDFSHVTEPMLAALYDRYSFSVLPRLGQMVTGNDDAYRYLAESIRCFPDQNTLADMMDEAGFEQVSYSNLSGGIAALHSGWRL